jgi:hypothetical protein
MIYNIFKPNNYSNRHYFYRFKENMGVSDKEVCIAIVVVTLLLLGAWVAIFFSMKSNQSGLFTPYVPPGMTGTYDGVSNGGVTGGSNANQQMPIYAPGPDAGGTGFFYPLGVQGYAGADELCSRKSVYTQAYNNWYFGPNAETNTSAANVKNGIKPNNPPHWMACHCCKGWTLPTDPTVSVDSKFTDLFPNLKCRQPNFTGCASS